MIRTLRSHARRAWGSARNVMRAMRRKLRGRDRVLDATRRPSVPGALVSYLAAPLRFRPGDKRFAGHTNAWECATIAGALAQRGYAIDGIDWFDDAFAPSRHYRLVLDLHRNLARLADCAETRWLHVTGSHPSFAFAAERARLDALEARRGVRLATRRSFDELDTQRFDSSLDVADVITMIGDAVTSSTLPSSAHRKVERIYVTGSPVKPRRRDDDFDDRTFFWFAGSGAVHKGLDLVLECFARHAELTLHCVGPYEAERDFVAAYSRELYRTPNIVSHGWIVPSDPRFATVAGRASAFILPSCSEGMSPAAVTCMSFGLIPIVTRRCGLDLPNDVGHVLDDGASGLELAVLEAAHRERQQLSGEIERTRRLADTRHSRAAFTSRMEALIARHIPRGDA